MQIVTSTKLNPEQLLERRNEAFRLRVEEGLSYRDIGAKMGYSKDVAEADCKHIAKLKYEGMIERDEMVRFEHEAHYDRLLSLWAPLLQPLIEGKLIVGETKYDRKGNAYDITIPEYEAAKTATEMMLKTMTQREKITGWQMPYSDGKPSKDALEGAGQFFFEMLRNLASQPAKPIQAEVIENGE